MILFERNIFQEIERIKNIVSLFVLSSDKNKTLIKEIMYTNVKKVSTTNPMYIYMTSDKSDFLSKEIGSLPSSQLIPRCSIGSGTIRFCAKEMLNLSVVT